MVEAMCVLRFDDRVAMVNGGGYWDEIVDETRDEARASRKDGVGFGHGLSAAGEAR